VPQKCQPPAVVITPAELDIVSVQAVRDRLLALIERGAVVVVVDMAATTFVDSAGMQALVAGCRPQVLRILGLAGLGRLMKTFPDVPAALGSAEELPRDR